MSMTDILFFSRDPGGTSVLIPVYFRIREFYKIDIWGKDYAINAWKKAGIACRDIEKRIPQINNKTIQQFLLQYSPKLVITGTSFEDKTEFMIWQECSSLEIPCFAFVDSWMNYKARFSNYADLSMVNDKSVVKYFYPDKILCIDSIAKDDMIKEGIPEDKIFIAGYWHLIYAKNKQLLVNNNEIKEYRKNVLGNEFEKKLFLFISEPLFKLYANSGEESGYGFNERSIFEYVIDALTELFEETNEYVLVVRPHPKEDMDYWRLKKNKITIPVIIDNNCSLECQLRSADLVMGMMSQCLNEVSCIGKIIASIQIGRTRQEPLFICRKNIIKPILDFSSLKYFLKDYFLGKVKPVTFNPDDDNCAKFIKLIEEEINHAKTGD